MATMLTQDQAAARLAVSKRTVQRLNASGDLPSVRVGARAVRISDDDLAAYIDSRRCR